MPEQAEKVVVLSTMLNDWRQGEVIDRKALVFPDPRGGDNPDHDAYDRLVAAGAVRPVREGEAGMAKVPVTGTGLSAAAAMKLGQLDAEIEQLTRNLGAMQERLTFHERANPAAAAAPEEDPAVAAAIGERQARLDGLKAQFDAMHARLGELQGQTAEADKARSEAASEARGGREQATGQAPPLEAAGQGGASTPEASPPPPEPERPKRSRRGRDAGDEQQPPPVEMFPPAEEPKG